MKCQENGKEAHANMRPARKTYMEGIRMNDKAIGKQCTERSYRHSKTTRAIAMLLVMAILTMSPLNVLAATKWETGCFGGGTSWTTTHYVYAESQRHWLPFGGTWYSAKEPTLTFYSYSGNGKERTGSTLYVEILRWNGDTRKWNCVYDYKVNNGQQIKLKLAYSYKHNDYSSPTGVHYWNRWAIRIRRYSKKTDVKWFGIKAGNGTFSY